MADPSGAGAITAAKRNQEKAPSGSASASTTVENCLSALPDDVLAKILFSVSTPDAVRTCILSRRWRPMWKLLPELRFPFFPEPAAQFRDALDGHQVPLRHLLVEGSHSAVPVSLSTWLPAAARRVSGSFVLRNATPMGNQREEATIQLPCFEKATSISICLWFLGSLAMPQPADGDAPGVFSHLTDLCLDRIWFHGASELSDVVSSARCPCLQKLKVCKTRGLEVLTVSSMTLLKMELEWVVGLRELTVDTPELKEFTVVHCFLQTLDTQVVVSIAVPGLVLLDWKDARSQRYFELNPSKVPHLRSLGSFLLFVYGEDGIGEDYTTYNNACLDLLQGFKILETLTLMLGYDRDMNNDYQYLLEDMRLLPGITTLHLIVISCGHSFGASSFHVLRMCTGIRKLVIELAGTPMLKGPFTCPSGCICEEQSNWKDEELILVPLREIEIQRFGLSNHDIGVVQRIFGWAKSLVKATVIFDISVTEDMAKEVCGMFKYFSRPEIHMNFKYHNNEKVFDAIEG